MRFFNLMILLLVSAYAHGQYTVTGTVTQKNSQEPIFNANVSVEGKYSAVTTDLEGKFSIDFSDDNEAVLVFNHLGYLSQSVKVSKSNTLVNIQLSQDKVSLAEVLVASSTVSAKTPVAYTQVSERDIEKLNFGQDLPYLLRMQPSMVTTSDAGTGIGYTGMRIRGSDASRINVTVNGIPLNDSESQGVFWVNMPDLGSSVNSIQIQRGVGTSTNGAGAFGGTVNLQTNKPKKTSHFSTSLATGSYGTQKANLEFSSGMIDNKWNLNGRLSQISSDGYIDRASADLTSVYLNGGAYFRNTTVQAMVILGHERTYQSWNGTPQSVLENDTTAMIYLADNVLFLDDEDKANLLNSGRTYNAYTYENQVDNYNQDHYQLHLTHLFSPYLSLNLSGHYTKGAGYFEQYKKGEDLADYNIDDIVIDEAQISSDSFDEDGNPINSAWGQNISNSDVSAFQSVALNANNDTIFDIGGNYVLNASTAITSSDIIRRRWLDNDFYGAVWSLNYKKNRLNTTLGGAANTYKGDHFGRVIWAEYAGNYVQSDQENAYYYFSDATKTDVNVYAKGTYQANKKLSVFGDLQVRSIGYQTQGIDSDLRPIDEDLSYTFFNPKVGATYTLNNNERYYASFAVANREPTRGDIIDAAPGTTPAHESLYDFEAGYYFIHPRLAINVNAYYMIYNNQLVLTGELNDVGSPIRTNVESSFRRGIEGIVGYKINQHFDWNVNLTLSQNKIEAFTESSAAYVYDENFDYVDEYVITTDFEDTDISFSPNVIFGSNIGYTLQRNKGTFQANLLSKYVGKQFLDNTNSDDRSLGDYLVHDLILRYSMKNVITKELGLSLAINNLASSLYSSNGYSYNYYSDFQDGLGGTTQVFDEQNAYYPQAPRNFLLQLDVKF